MLKVMDINQSDLFIFAVWQLGFNGVEIDGLEYPGDFYGVYHQLVAMEQGLDKQ